ncbi:uncharacterized protein LOC142332412 [Lycorma delicatula]|uniref:uncharacterized protein LOC142332412 n=1 Tax=Lycorma delicatula TaxID=130591 RepID=UPI003F50EFE5
MDVYCTEEMSGGGGRPAYLRSAPIRRLRHPLDESPAWALIGACLWGLLGLMLALPLLIILAIVLPATFILRWFLLMLYWNRQRSSNSSSNINSSTSGGLESMRGNDSRWLGTSWQCSVLHAVLMFETPLEVSTLQQLLLSRVVPVYPRLTRRPVSLPLVAGAGYCWLPDCNFSIENHVFPGPNLPSAEHQIQEYVSQLLCKGLANDKPPWELHVLRQCAVLRVHQSVADGTSLVKLLCHCLADTKIISNTQNRRRPLSFYCDVLRACLLGPLSLLFWLLMSSPDCNLLTQSTDDSKGGVKVNWSAAISFAKVTRVKQVTRSTINCVLLSALSGALRCLLQNCGVRQPPDLKVLLPVDLRRCTQTSSTRLGNKMAPVVITLPVGMEGAVPRLWNTRKTLNTLKRSTDPVVVYVATAALMSILPGHFARQILSNISEDKASLQFSSQIGPTSNIMMGGCTLKSVYALLPAQSHLNVAVSVFTYGDQLFVTVATDHALGPAGNILLHHLQAQIELLYNLLKYRRVPGEMKSDTNVYRFPDVTRSPVREIAYRLNHVQEEVQRLSRHDANESEKLQRLKAEFSHLLRELRKRKASSSPEQDIDLWDHQFRSRRRSMSCSFTRRSSGTLLSILSTNRPVSYIETSNTSLTILSRSPSPSPSLSRMTSPSSTSTSSPLSQGYHQKHQQQQQYGRRNTTSTIDGITHLKQQLPNDIYYRRTSTPIFGGNERLTNISECEMCYDETIKQLSHQNLFKIRCGQHNVVKSFSQPSSVNEPIYYCNKNNNTNTNVEISCNNIINKKLILNYRSQPIVKTSDTLLSTHDDGGNNEYQKQFNFNSQKLNLPESIQRKIIQKQNCSSSSSSNNYNPNNKTLENGTQSNKFYLMRTDSEIDNSNRHSNTKTISRDYIYKNFYTHHNNTNIDSHNSDDDLLHTITDDRLKQKRKSKVGDNKRQIDSGKGKINNCKTNENSCTNDVGLYDEILNVIKDNEPLTSIYKDKSQTQTSSNLPENNPSKITNSNNHNNSFEKKEIISTQTIDLNGRHDFTNDTSKTNHLMTTSPTILEHYVHPCCSKDIYNSSDEISKQQLPYSYTSSNREDGQSTYILPPVLSLDEQQNSVKHDVLKQSYHQFQHKQPKHEGYDAAIESLSNFANKVHILSNIDSNNCTESKNNTKRTDDKNSTGINNDKTCNEESLNTFNEANESVILKNSKPFICQMKCSNCHCNNKAKQELQKTIHNDKKDGCNHTLIRPTTTPTQQVQMIKMKSYEQNYKQPITNYFANQCSGNTEKLYAIKNYNNENLNHPEICTNSSSSKSSGHDILYHTQPYQSTINSPPSSSQSLTSSTSSVLPTTLHKIHYKNSPEKLKTTMINTTNTNVKEQPVTTENNLQYDKQSTSSTSSSSLLCHCQYQQPSLTPIMTATKIDTKTIKQNKCNCDNTKIKLIECKNYQHCHHQSSVQMKSQSESFYANGFSYSNNSNSSNRSTPNSSLSNYDKVTFI